MKNRAIWIGGVAAGAVALGYIFAKFGTPAATAAPTTPDALALKQAQDNATSIKMAADYAAMLQANAQANALRAAAAAAHMSPADYAKAVAKSGNVSGGSHGF
jgi:hypothetical protein